PQLLSRGEGSPRVDVRQPPIRRQGDRSRKVPPYRPPHRTLSTEPGPYPPFLLLGIVTPRRGLPAQRVRSGLRVAEHLPHLLEEGLSKLLAIGIAEGAFADGRPHLEELGGDLLEKGRGLSGERLGSATAGPAAGEGEAMSRAGDPHVEEATLLGDGVGRGALRDLVHASGVWQDLLLQSDQEDVGELESFRAVEREQRDLVGPILVLRGVVLQVERDTLEEARERRWR